MLFKWRKFVIVNKLKNENNFLHNGGSCFHRRCRLSHTDYDNHNIFCYTRFQSFWALQYARIRILPQHFRPRHATFFDLDRWIRTPIRSVPHGSSQDWRHCRGLQKQPECIKANNPHHWWTRDHYRWTEKAWRSQIILTCRLAQSSQKSWYWYWGQK